MIKIQYKELDNDGVFYLSIEQPNKTLENEFELLDYVSAYLRNVKSQYTWFKIIT